MKIFSKKMKSKFEILRQNCTHRACPRIGVESGEELEAADGRRRLGLGLATETDVVWLKGVRLPTWERRGGLHPPP